MPFTRWVGKRAASLYRFGCVCVRGFACYLGGGGATRPTAPDPMAGGPGTCGTGAGQIVRGRGGRLRKQVQHGTAPANEKWKLGGALGDCSVTLMLRCDVFPHHRSRVRNATPSPQGFFFSLAESIRRELTVGDWLLPGLADCQASLVPDVMPKPPAAKKGRKSAK